MKTLSDGLEQIEWIDFDDGVLVVDGSEGFTVSVDPEHDARIRADERARVLAAVLSAHRIYWTGDNAGEDSFAEWVAKPGNLPEGDTALRDLLAREREAGRQERSAGEWRDLDHAYAQGAREALESRADERAKVLAAVLESIERYAEKNCSPVGDARARFLLSSLSTGLREGWPGPDGDTALRDLLAREREAGRHEGLAVSCGAPSLESLRDVIRDEFDAARAHGAKEALTSAAEYVRREGIGPRPEYLAQVLDDRANAIDPTTYADTLRAEARRGALIEASKVASAYATEKSRYAVAESAGLEIAERLRVLAIAKLRTAAGKGAGE